ncbi:FAD-binding oxidoreductase [Desulfococcus multivorans]|uniref:FAD linked oxidase domain-containing protein n=1 Tax=Desulfococcus multivorans DSM 2059 TaxID=1121405 RepID=S7TXS0_DESML|nr:FAD-binding oxidoreductase [Desulfococcus multivorans]AOY56829.1 FAD linked oxidoreductase [Desulfococcus multivorans]AQV02801.2 FAD-linked oxidase [Desulfococcus multivorans]EPR41842.1 FAD linked oxidase domain-containing protein [Desulfococcus multivorans DSM 2059]SJZ92931.1 FAD/FMN-containing dehydrogenase [Desulfococcus multivorans DSM 2059]
MTTTTFRVVRCDGSSVLLEKAAVDGFRERLRGTLITPADEAYDSARRVWNGMIDRRPGLMIRCAGTADVIAAVNFAREHGLLITVRGGGHNVAGSALMDDGFVIDLSGMRGVHVDPEGRLARVEGGARLRDLDHETQAFGLAAPVGVVSATGVGGLTLHGGAGWLLRKHGFSIDNLVSVEMVTADGQFRKASENENSDLFWAVRGGGGNFGVVTAFEFRLHPVGPRVWMAVPMYPLEQAETVVNGLRNYMAEADENLMVLAVFWSAPDAPEIPAAVRGAPVVILMGCYTGPFEVGEKAIAPLRTLGRPVADLSAPMRWVEVQKFLDADYPDGAFYYWKSLYLDRLDTAVIRSLVKYTENRPSSLSSIDIWMLGGASTTAPTSESAFWRRDAPFMLGIEANWKRREEADKNIEWARRLHKAMRLYSRDGIYLNFPGFMEDRDTLLRSAYGPNLARLRAVKAHHDPTGLFSGLLNMGAGTGFGAHERS